MSRKKRRFDGQEIRQYDTPPLSDLHNFRQGYNQLYQTYRNLERSYNELKRYNDQIQAENSLMRKKIEQLEQDNLNLKMLNLYN